MRDIEVEAQCRRCLSYWVQPSMAVEARVKHYKRFLCPDCGPGHPAPAGRRADA